MLVVSEQKDNDATYDDLVVVIALENSEEGTGQPSSANCMNRADGLGNTMVAIYEPKNE